MLEENEGYFDFEEKEEFNEDLDFRHLKPCPYCKQPIPQNAISCLYCGNSLSSSRRPKWIIWVAIFVIIVFLLLILF